MTEASAIHSPSTPRAFRLGSTTAADQFVKGIIVGKVDRVAVGEAVIPERRRLRDPVRQANSLAQDLHVTWIGEEIGVDQRCLRGVRTP